MRQNILTIRQSLPKLLTFSFLLLAFVSCKKADNFYDDLQKLPQINNMPEFAYKTTYIIGDTMVINGHLQPKNDLRITIGGITAKIVKIDSAQYNKGDIDNTLLWMDRVSLVITADMEGKGREVKVTSGGYSVAGASVDIYSAGGLGSFTDSLKAVTVKALSSDQNIFLYCINGKGDLYYYAPTTKDLRHLKKDGSEEVMYDLSKSISLNGNVFISSFLAGGVDPERQNLYFSVQTDQGDYRLMQLNLQSNTLNTLNQSTALSAPYEGNIADVNIIVSGIYPDSKGNLYLTAGLGSNAIVRYTKEDSRLSYIYKRGTTYAGMPGNGLVLSKTLKEFKFSPDENLVYALETDFTTATFEVFDLSARVKLTSFSTSLAGARSPFDAIAPLSELKLSLGSLGPDQCFGFLPLPGRRLQSLIYQSTDGFTGAEKSGFPKWIVFDFTGQRSYAYAPGRFNQGNFIFQPTSSLSPSLTAVDVMLNYDEAGNLYMTANGKMNIVKTQTIN